jgi:hypothetical protein
MSKFYTVFLTFLCNHLYHLTICPRCHRFSELFSSVFLFTCFEMLQILDCQQLQAIKRQSVYLLPNEIIPVPDRSCFSFAARLSSFDLVSNGFEISSVVIATRVTDEFVHTDVDTKEFTLPFDGQVRQFNPKDNSIFRKSTALYKLGKGFGNPFIDNGSFLCGNRDFLALLKTGYPDDQVEAPLAIFNRNEFAIQNGRAPENRNRARLAKCLCGFLCGYDGFQSLFEGLAFVSLGETGFARWESGKGIFVEFAPCFPKGFDVEIDGSPVGFKQSIDTPLLRFSSKFKTLLF